MEYERDPKCECRGYVDVDTLPYDKRIIEKFWMRGFIYDGSKSKECNCHKRYRLTQRYNCIAKNLDLPSAEELDELNYLGEGDSYNKLSSLPDIIERNNFKDVIIYCSGAFGNQKTTSALKVMLDLIRKGKWVVYADYTKLTKQLLDLDSDTKEYRNADYLIIDGFCEGEVINFQTTFNELFDIILKRRKPTILISSKKLDEIKFTHYDMSLLDGIKLRCHKYNSYVEFNDHAANVLLKEKGPIDIWSM